MKVLIAEDEPTIAGILEANLKHAGFDSVIVDNGPDVIRCMGTEQPDIVLLDIMLPGKDGYEVCKELRQQYDVPIIMITAKTSELERLKGFDIGADDYVCKPFSPREVIARIKSIMRRGVANPTLEARIEDKGLIESVPEFIICKNSLTASFMGEELKLTTSEFNLIATLVSHPNRVFERAQLLDILSQQGNECTDRAIDSHIKNLRQKLRKIAKDKSVIQSVYGVGYKFSHPIV